jgi:murein DD-endopeptidase MepM/ murein hydrolase activator NlpD
MINLGGALVNRRRVVAGLAVAATVLLVAMPTGAARAQGQDELEDAEQDAAEALEHATERERAAAREYKEATRAMPAAEARLAAAREQVDEAQGALESAEDEMVAAEAALDGATGRQERLQTEVDSVQERLAEIAVNAYKTGDMYSVTAVLAAAGPQDVINRLGYTDRIAAEEDDALADLAVAEEAAGQARTEADQALQAADQASQDARQALDDARDAKRDAQEAADELAALVETRRDALAVAAEEREKAEAELAQVEEDLRAWERAHRDSAAELESGLTLLMPVDGVKTSDYGTRIDPITGEERLHAGVDIAAAGGTPIVAAAGGTVIQAGWNGGYGNFTCLGHGTYEGQGLSTCYAHQSEILVAAGQTVQAGDVIGRVGSTGNSTGDHLHFEVRLDGAPTSPLPWLPDCLC